MKNKYLILILTCILYLGANSQNNVTFQVDMNTVDPTTFTTPEVNGTFNGWCGNCAAMSDLDGDNIWDVTIDLANGTYEFKYSADNWTIQESLFSGDSCTNGNTQYTNRMLTVSGDTTLPVVCWGSCSGCNSGPSSYSVTFELDMRGVTDPHNTPEVNGDFNSWCGNCWQMADADGDSIWQFSSSFAPGDTIEWKYSADNWSIQEDLDSNLSCITINYDPSAPNGWGYVNRLAVVNSDTTFSSPWNLCSSSSTISGCTDSLASNYNPLATVDDGSCLYNITFNVDMNCDTIGFGFVHLESPDFGWCGGCVPMSDPDGDGVHSVSIDIPLGNFEYKYAVDNFSSDENLIDDMLNGGTCAPITDYFSFANRELIVSAGVSTNDTYSSCDSCILNPIITSHTINAGNYYYNPNYLIINVGDTVTWINDGGYHDVNGNINSLTGLSFNNPVSFYLPPVSGPATIGSYIFTVAGTYDYDCSIGSHASNGMIGTILVNTPSLSQIDLPITWDDTTVDYTVTDFGGNSSSLSVDPLDPTNNVMMSEKTVGAQTWAGTTLSTPSGLLSSIPFVSGSTTISAHVYSTSAGTVVRLKAEDHTDPTRSVETEATTTVANGWNTLVFDFANEAPGTAMIDFSYNYDMLSIFYDFGNNGVGDIYYLDSVAFGGLVGGILGCTDPLASNYDPLATIDDGTCTYCTYGCTDSTAFNYDSLATCDDGSCIPLIYGCTDSTAINYFPGANTDDGSCIYSGCTDPLATNYDPIATIDDGSCIYMNCTDPSPTGLANNWVTDTKAEITWDNMNDSACMVLKYFVRYREIGTPTWTTKSAGVGNGLCNFGLNTTTKTLQNLTSGTTYEYKMKAFYCGGTESNYSAPSQFTTAADCPPMTNLTSTTFNGNQSKVRFDWDTTGAYVFARVALRVDTVGASWQTAGGFGVYYPTLQVNKFGLQSGESYRAQGRTFCDSNITSYRSWWTAPIFWTQPGTIRLGGGITINNLDIYPNPTNDIFNVSFVSDEIQTLDLRVLNIVGEVIYTENLDQFVGEYTKQISIGNNAKGVYFLEITDNQGTINKKIIVK